MNKYMFLSYGFKPPTPEIQQAWGKWFASIGDRIVDGGNPFKAGREITQQGVKDLPIDLEALTGYCIFNAESLEEATKIAQACPIITSARVYEAGSM
jgi:hypothetical protein